VGADGLLTLELTGSPGARTLDVIGRVDGRGTLALYFDEGDEDPFADRGLPDGRGSGGTDGLSPSAPEDDSATAGSESAVAPATGPARTQAGGQDAVARGVRAGAGRTGPISEGIPNERAAADGEVTGSYGWVPKPPRGVPDQFLTFFTGANHNIVGPAVHGAAHGPELRAAQRAGLPRPRTALEEMLLSAAAGDATARARIRSAAALERAGYAVRGTSALQIEGRTFAHYAPTGGGMRTLRSWLEHTVSAGRAERAIVDLIDSTVSAEELAAALRAHPLPGLTELLLIDPAGGVTRVVPAVSAEESAKPPRRAHPVNDGGRGGEPGDQDPGIGGPADGGDRGSGDGPPSPLGATPGPDGELPPELVQWRRDSQRRLERIRAELLNTYGDAAFNAEYGPRGQLKLLRFFTEMAERGAEGAAYAAEESSDIADIIAMLEAHVALLDELDLLTRRIELLGRIESALRELHAGRPGAPALTSLTAEVDALAARVAEQQELEDQPLLAQQVVGAVEFGWQPGQQRPDSAVERQLRDRLALTGIELASSVPGLDPATASPEQLAELLSTADDSARRAAETLAAEYRTLSSLIEAIDLVEDRDNRLRTGATEIEALLEATAAALPARSPASEPTELGAEVVALRLRDADLRETLHELIGRVGERFGLVPDEVDAATLDNLDFQRAARAAELAGLLSDLTVDDLTPDRIRRLAAELAPPNGNSRAADLIGELALLDAVRNVAGHLNSLDALRLRSVELLENALAEADTRLRAAQRQVTELRQRKAGTWTEQEMSAARAEVTRWQHRLGELTGHRDRLGQLARELRRTEQSRDAIERALREMAYGQDMDPDTAGRADEESNRLRAEANRLGREVQQALVLAMVLALSPPLPPRAGMLSNDLVGGVIGEIVREGFGGFTAGASDGFAAGATGGLIGGLIGGSLSGSLGQPWPAHDGRLTGALSWSPITSPAEQRVELYVRRAEYRTAVVRGVQSALPGDVDATVDALLEDPSSAQELLRKRGVAGDQATEIAADVAEYHRLTRRIDEEAEAGAREMRARADELVARIREAAGEHEPAPTVGKIPRTGSCVPLTRLAVNDYYRGVRGDEPEAELPEVRLDLDGAPGAALSWLLRGHADFRGKGVAGHQAIEDVLLGAEPGRAPREVQRRAHSGRGDGGDRHL
jgi:hypothetical protein